MQPIHEINFLSTGDFFIEAGAKLEFSNIKLTKVVFSELEKRLQNSFKTKSKFLKSIQIKC